MLEFEQRTWQKITDNPEKTEVLCLSANKLLNSAGMRTDIANGLVHSLTASTTKEVKVELGRICSVLGNLVSGPIFLLVVVLCRIEPHLCQHVMLYECIVCILNLQT